MNLFDIFYSFYKLKKFKKEFNSPYAKYGVDITQEMTLEKAKEIVYEQNHILQKGLKPEDYAVINNKFAIKVAKWFAKEMLFVINNHKAYQKLYQKFK